MATARICKRKKLERKSVQEKEEKKTCSTEDFFLFY